MICNSVYRHCKGTDYRVIAVATKVKTKPIEKTERFAVYLPNSVNPDQDWKTFTLIAKHSETQELMLVYRTHEGVFCIQADCLKEFETNIWVRPLDNFLQILHSGSFGDFMNDTTTNYARFQLISGDPISL